MSNYIFIFRKDNGSFQKNVNRAMYLNKYQNNAASKDCVIEIQVSGLFSFIPSWLVLTEEHLGRSPF